MTKISPWVKCVPRQKRSDYIDIHKGTQGTHLGTTRISERRQGTTLFKPKRGKVPHPSNNETQHRSTTRMELPKNQGGTPRKNREKPCYPKGDRKQPNSEKLPHKTGTYSSQNKHKYKAKKRTSNTL